MGNAASTNSPPKDDKEHPPQSTRTPRRRESIQVLPHTRPSAAPPSASLESAQGSSISRSSTRASDQTPSQTRSTTASHVRKRSQTTASPVSRLQHAAHQEESGKVQGSLSTDRGNSQAIRSSSPSQPIKVSPSTQPPQDPNFQPVTLEPNKQPTSESSPPGYMAPNSHFARPPRLPLPIERNEFSPGSPILSPADVSGAIGHDEDQKAMRRTHSDFSATTADEEDLNEEFRVGGPSGPTVDTIIEWKEPGERVYVTGSFSGWNRKHRLHRNGPSPDRNVLSTILPLPAGTHHLTFLVDGNMRTSIHMPTAVDYTNALINYVAISAEDVVRQNQPLPAPTREQPPKQTHVLPTRHHAHEQHERAAHLPPPTPELRPTVNSTAPSAGPSGMFSPNVTVQAKQAGSAAGSAAHSQTHLALKKHPEKAYHSEIPKFLLDLDAPEESSRFQRVGAVMATQPAPPALPMFLNKSILNGSLPMKDDSSVLHMPNHTVLNHLATSSIKNNVLATSATTRYRQKYVTTIMYRPTSDDGP